MPGYGYIRERKRPPRSSAKPQMTSFADVTLVLLVIFLVSAAAAVQMVTVALPQAVNTAGRDINLAVTISISNKPPPKAEGEKGKDKAVVPAPKEKTGDEKEEEKDKEKDPWLFYFEDDATGIEAKNLWTVLKATKGDNAWPLALIRADKNTPCEHVSILIQCMQGLGVDEIAFQSATGEEEPEEERE